MNAGAAEGANRTFATVAANRGFCRNVTQEFLKISLFFQNFSLFSQNFCNNSTFISNIYMYKKNLPNPSQGFHYFFKDRMLLR